MLVHMKRGDIWPHEFARWHSASSNLPRELLGANKYWTSYTSYAKDLGDGRMEIIHDISVAVPDDVYTRAMAKINTPEENLLGLVSP